MTNIINYFHKKATLLRQSLVAFLVAFSLLGANTLEAQTAYVGTDSTIILVVNLTTGAVVDQIIGLPGTPVKIAASPNGQQLAVATITSVVIISTADNTIDTIIRGFSEVREVLYSPNGNTIYAIDQLTTLVTPINATTFAQGDFGFANGAAGTIGAAFNPATGELVVVNNGSSNLSRYTVNPLAQVGNNIAVGQAPQDIAFLPNGTAYVTNFNNNNVSVVNVAAGSSTTIAGFNQPTNLVIAPNGTVYVINSQNNTIGVLNSGTGAVGTAITVGTVPRDLALTPDSTQLVVTNAGANSLSIISIANNTVTRTISNIIRPISIAITNKVSPPANIRPVARFTATPTSGRVPLTVNVNASASTDSLGLIASYSWDFGDGNRATGVTASNLYDSAGTFTIRLVVADRLGLRDTATVTITVTSGDTVVNFPPDARFTATPTSGQAPLTVNFNASASTDSLGRIVSYTWDFGNGSTGTGVTTSTTYNTAGTFTARLIVADSLGLRDTATATITVTPRDTMVGGGGNARATLQAILDTTTVIGASGLTFGGVSAAVIDTNGNLITVVTGQATPAIPIDSSLRFGAAEFTQTLLATLAFRLRETGQLNLDAPISTYINTSTLTNVPGTITVRQLLNQTSGLDDFSTDSTYLSTVLFDVTRQFTPAELTQLFVGTPSAPGTFRYSNTNFLVLGLVLDAANGAATLQQSLDSLVLTPAGLTNSGVVFYPAGTTDPTGLAPLFADVFATGFPNQLTPNTSVFTGASFAGNILGTPTQLLQFLQALAEGEILRDSSLQQLLTFVNTTGRLSARYGSGIEQFNLTIDGVQLPFIGVVGGINYVTAALYSSQAKVGVVVTTNNGVATERQILDLAISLLDVVLDGTTVGDTTETNFPPDARFTATPTSGTAPLTVSFDASASTDSLGRIVSYEWNFGNGRTGTGVTTSTTYDSAGTYTVVLTVRDSFGLSDTASTRITVTRDTTVRDTAAFTLQLLHASDLEGGIEAIENAPNFAAIIDTLEETFPNTIILSAGDNFIPGPFFNAAGDPALAAVLRNVYQSFYNEPGLTGLLQAPGRIDISIMNIIGFDASAVGNHEFDAGPTAFAEVIRTDIPTPPAVGTARWLGAQFPYLSANLDFRGESALNALYTGQIRPSTDFQSLPSNLTAARTAPKLAPATIVNVNGERIGVVGATTQVLRTITSSGNVALIGRDSNDMPALAAVIQPYIDSFTNRGINKVILVSHLQQLAFERQLAGLLRNVDIIIAGGSETLIAQPDDRLRPGDVATDTYPVQATSANGNPVAIVSTPGEYSYVGRLVARFDSAGVLIRASLTDTINGVIATDSANVARIAGANAFRTNSKGELVRRLTNAVDSIVTAQDRNILGRTSVYLEGRREVVRTQQTNLGDLTADANLAAARQVDSTVIVSIKNGGGIRSSIGEIVETSPGVFVPSPPQPNPQTGKQLGDISQLDVVNSLRFNNNLTLLTVSLGGLIQILEHGVADTRAGNTPGRFPQVSGIKFVFDTTRAAGSRLVDLYLLNSNDQPIDTLVRNGVAVEDTSRSIRLVTLSFLADGGDGYPFNRLLSNRVELTTAITTPGSATFAAPGSEQDAFAEYLLANFRTTPYNKAETPPAQDNRIMFGRRDTTVVQPDARFTATPTSGRAPLTVQFNASASTGRGLTYAWVFGNGRTGTGVSTSTTYDSAGVYTVVLTVRDSAGQTDTAQVRITVTGDTAVTNFPPDARFTATPTSGTAPLTVNFDASASTDSLGSIVSYTWNFGNGQTGTGVTTSTTYAAAGTYRAVLTVRDSFGLSDTASVVITVSPRDTTGGGGGTDTLRNSLQVILDRSNILNISGLNFGGVSAAVIDTNGNVITVVTGQATPAIPMDTTKRLGASDITQTLLATLAFKLRESGQLNLDAPISTYINTSSLTNVPGTITVRQLLMHTSGLDEFSGDSAYIRTVLFDVTRRFTPAEITQLFVGPAVAPGTFRYANTNFLVLGLVLDAINGAATLQQSLDSLVLRPAGLVNSGITFYQPDTIDPVDLAPLFDDVFGTGFPQQLTPNTSIFTGASFAGNAYATPRQLLQFLEALAEGEILDSTSLQEMLAFMNISGRLSRQYGKGIERFSLNIDGVNLPFIGHIGDINYTSVALYSLEAGVGVVVQTNNGQVTENRILQLAIELLDAAIDGRQVRVNLEPNAVITANPTSGPAPLTVNFSAAGSDDPDGTIVSYSWNFGNGQTATGITATTTYAANGTYRAVLTVRDNAGATDTASVTITVRDTVTAPTLDARFTATPTSGIAPLRVNFDASASTGRIASYNWNFGNGQTGTGRTTSATYNTAGTYTVILTVRDSSGATDTASTRITVRPVPSCNVTFNTGRLEIIGSDVRCYAGTRITANLRFANGPTVPTGYSLAYVVTRGNSNVITQVSRNLSITADTIGLYRIQVLIYDSTTLNLNELVGTTTSALNSRLISSGGNICGAFDRSGIVFIVQNCNNPVVTCPSGLATGRLVSSRREVCLNNNRQATLTATVQQTAGVPAGYRVLYVLTSGDNRVIQQVSPTPSFTVTGANLYRIHVLVYDSTTLNLSNVRLGVTTAAQVNALLVQGGGRICAALDVAGLTFETRDCACGAYVGALGYTRPNGSNLCLSEDGIAFLVGNTVQRSVVPLGYRRVYVLTSGNDLIIQRVADIPVFGVRTPGTYRIHTLIYDPNTLNLNTIQLGVTSATTIVPLLRQGGGNICAGLDVDGLLFRVSNCGSSGNLTAYPNPTTDFVNISLPEYQEVQRITIEVFNNAGVRAKQLILDGFTERTILDLSDVQPGMYHVRILYDKTLIQDMSIVKMK